MCFIGHFHTQFVDNFQKNSLKSHFLFQMDTKKFSTSLCAITTKKKKTGEKEKSCKLVSQTIFLCFAVWKYYLGVHLGRFCCICLYPKKCSTLFTRAGSVSKFAGFGFFKEVEYGFRFLRFFILQNFSVSVLTVLPNLKFWF